MSNNLETRRGRLLNKRRLARQPQDKTFLIEGMSERGGRVFGRVNTYGLKEGDMTVNQENCLSFLSQIAGTRDLGEKKKLLREAAEKALLRETVVGLGTRKKKQLINDLMSNVRNGSGVRWTARQIAGLAFGVQGEIDKEKAEIILGVDGSKRNFKAKKKLAKLALAAAILASCSPSVASQAIETSTPPPAVVEVTREPVEPSTDIPVFPTEEGTDVSPTLESTEAVDPTVELVNIPSLPSKFFSADFNSLQMSDEAMDIMYPGGGETKEAFQNDLLAMKASFEARNPGLSVEWKFFLNNTNPNRPTWRYLPFSSETGEVFVAVVEENGIIAVDPSLDSRKAEFEDSTRLIEDLRLGFGSVFGLEVSSYTLKSIGEGSFLVALDGEGKAIASWRKTDEDPIAGNFGRWEMCVDFSVNKLLEGGLVSDPEEAMDLASKLVWGFDEEAGVWNVQGGERSFSFSDGKLSDVVGAPTQEPVPTEPPTQEVSVPELSFDKEAVFSSAPELWTLGEDKEPVRIETGDLDLQLVNNEMANIVNEQGEVIGFIRASGIKERLESGSNTQLLEVKWFTKTGGSEKVGLYAQMGDYERTASGGGVSLHVPEILPYIPEELVLENVTGRADQVIVRSGEYLDDSERGVEGDTPEDVLMRYVRRIAFTVYNLENPDSPLSSVTEIPDRVPIRDENGRVSEWVVGNGFNLVFSEDGEPKSELTRGGMYVRDNGVLNIHVSSLVRQSFNEPGYRTFLREPMTLIPEYYVRRYFPSSANIEDLRSRLALTLISLRSVDGDDYRAFPVLAVDRPE